MPRLHKLPASTAAPRARNGSAAALAIAKLSTGPQVDYLIKPGNFLGELSTYPRSRASCFETHKPTRYDDGLMPFTKGQVPGQHIGDQGVRSTLPANLDDAGVSPLEAIRILIVEDHQIVRHCLREILAREKDFVLVGEASDGAEAMELVEQLAPHIILLDLELPSLSGMEVLSSLAEIQSQCRAIMLSAHSDEELVRAALARGAKGYVTKAAQLSELVCGIRKVASGHLYLSTSLSDRAIYQYGSVSREAPGVVPPISLASTSAERLAVLTRREREVLLLMAEGYGNPQIAANLTISPRTAEVHRANIMRKLGLLSQTELVHFAIQQGLIQVKKS